MGITLLVARDRRRAVIWLAAGITTGLAVGWWIIGRIRQAILDEVAAPDSRAAIQAILHETAASFRTYLLVVLVIAVVAALTAFLAARLDDVSRGGRWVRQQFGDEPTPLNRWVSAHHDGLRTVGFVVSAVALLAVGIDVVPFLLIGALLGLFVVAIGALRHDRPAAEHAPTEP